MSIVPWTLGIAGLIPFVGSSAALYYNVKFAGVEDWIKVQKYYGCSILSFMGAVHWGLAMARFGKINSNNARYVLSTVPSLVGFFGLLAEDPVVTLSTQLVGFNGLLAADLFAHRRSLAPSWYFPMRLFLTTVVSSSLIFTINHSRKTRIKY